VTIPADLAQAVLDLNHGWNAKEPEHLIAERIDFARRLANQILEATLSQTGSRQPDSEPESPQAEPVVNFGLTYAQRITNRLALWRHHIAVRDAIAIAAEADAEIAALRAPPAAAQGGQPGDGNRD
jgi:hypothetical protein